MRQKLLIYGAGKLGRQIYYHLTNYYKDSATVEGFIDDLKAEGTEVTDGVRCLGGLDELAISELYPAQEYSCVFGIGYSDMTARQFSPIRLNGNQGITEHFRTFLLLKYHN